MTKDFFDGQIIPNNSISNSTFAISYFSESNRPGAECIGFLFVYDFLFDLLLNVSFDPWIGISAYSLRSTSQYFLSFDRNLIRNSSYCVFCSTVNEGIV